MLNVTTSLNNSGEYKGAALYEVMDNGNVNDGLLHLNNIEKGKLK